MRRRVEVWMWALPLLVASLVFWPMWLFLILGGIARVLAGGSSEVGTATTAPERGPWRHKLRGIPRRAGEALVEWIGRWKYHLLAFAAVVAGALAVTAIVLFAKGEGELASHYVHEVEGYLAVTGVVLGLPALAYAMVTDSAVGRIETQLGRARRKEIEAQMTERLQVFEQEYPDHSMQVFVPDPHHEWLRPVYDPDEDGPEEGWSIDRKTPQALSGSAWVGRTYLAAKGAGLEQPKLRLTRDQLKRYEGLKAVAAAPIFGKGGRDDPLGVLAVFSKTNDQVIKTDAFRARHEEVAKSLAPIIADYVPETGALSPQDLSS
jgi:hypothetical protein